MKKDKNSLKIVAAFKQRGNNLSALHLASTSGELWIKSFVDGHLIGQQGGDDKNIKLHAFTDEEKAKSAYYKRSEAIVTT